MNDLIDPIYRHIDSVCVYCGSAQGNDPTFAAAARAFGHKLASSGITLVYGGGSRGLMGVLANAVLEHGGRVTGIMPTFLAKDGLFLETVQRREVVPDMHTRKRLMFEKADAFVALPGGIGTLEELVEQLTWVQLERHTKPVLIADIGGFWRPLLDVFAHMRTQGFIQAKFEIRYLVAEAVDDILPMLETAAERTAKLGRTKTDIDPRL